MPVSAPRQSAVARVLTEPCLILGVEKPLAIVNATLAMVLVAELHLWAFLPVCTVAHLVLARLTRQDPFLRGIYVRYNLQADRYEPWPQPGDPASPFQPRSLRAGRW